MIVQSQSGLRCQGLYRGTVIQHLPHGRLKVFIYGVYPDEYFNHPELLPICEQLTPLWGGSANGNGSFSYPNIGSSVFVQFANEDVNQPIAIGATLGGQNAYNQYNNIKAQDEAVSKKHLLTTGMAHLQMHESGKISAYVQQPYDNDVSVDFSHGDVSCEISADVAKKIDENQLSHIVVQQVLDNSLNKGEISSSTHFYEPHSSYTSVYLSDMQENIVSSNYGEVSALNCNVKNNLGQDIDSQVCSMSDSQYCKYTNRKLKYGIIFRSDNREVKSCNESTNIDGKKDLKLEDSLTRDEYLTKLSLKDNGGIALSSYHIDHVKTNSDSNQTDDARTAKVNDKKTVQSKGMLYNIADRMLSSTQHCISSSNDNSFSLQLNGTKDIYLENDIVQQDKLYYTDENHNAFIISNDILQKHCYTNDFLDNGSHTGDIQQQRVSLSSLSDDQFNLRFQPGSAEILAQNNTIDCKIRNNANVDEIVSDVERATSRMTTAIDVYAGVLSTTEEDIYSNTGIITSEKYKSTELKTCTRKNMQSYVDFGQANEIITLLDKQNSQLSIDQQGILLGCLSAYDYKDLLEENVMSSDNITSDNHLTLDNSNKAELLTRVEQYANEYFIKSQRFVLSGEAAGHALLELDNNTGYTTYKNTKVELSATYDDSSAEIRAYDAANNRECKTTMSTASQKIETIVKNYSTRNALNLTMDLDNETIVLKADSKYMCTIKLDSSTGEITVTSPNVNIVAEKLISLKSNSMIAVYAADQLDLQAGGTVNITGTLNVNNEANFNDKVRLLNTVDSNINMPTGNIVANAVGASTVTASSFIEA